jgi:hypothetical protein
MDEGTLNQAFSVLQGRFGNRLGGDMLKGEVAMRHALMDDLKIDESAADKLVKQLTQTAWIRFRGGADTGDTDDTALPEGWRDSRVAGTDAVHDVDTELLAPLAAESSTMSVQQSGNQGPGGGGGAILAGAAAADLARNPDQPGERPDPTRDANQISSEAADRGQASVERTGYWQLSGPPPVATP